MRLPLPLSSIFVLLLLAGCSACASTSSEPSTGPAPPAAGELVLPGGEYVRAELVTVGWDALSGGPVVLLRELSRGQVLPIWIGLAEARAIVQALNGVLPPRPQTHDLMADLLGHLGGELEEVVVTDLRGGTYYGLLKLRLQGRDEPRWVDTRPSDGLALALRTGAAIRISAELLIDRPEFEFLAPDVEEQIVRVLGLTVRAPTAELGAQLGLPEGRDGLLVVGVSGEARRKGLKPGDLIVDIGGRTPQKPLDLLDAIREAAEKVLPVTYWRDGEETTVELEIDVESSPEPGERGQIA